MCGADGDSPATAGTAPAAHHVRPRPAAVGSHGAALTWELYLPPHAYVLEFGTASDYHYANLARYVGLLYRMLPGPAHTAPSFFANLDLTEGAVRTALDVVAPHMWAAGAVGGPHGGASRFDALQSRPAASRAFDPNVAALASRGMVAETKYPFRAD